MKINLLGSRGEIEVSAPYRSKKSGVLVDDLILLDIGEKQFLDYNPKYILITHLHPDHAYFVRNYEKPHNHIPLYAPESYNDVKIHLTHKPFSIEGYSIIPIPTIHSLKVKSNAYLIMHKNKRLLYTGDLVWIEQKYHHLFDHLDLVITEASFMRKGGLVRSKEGKMFGHNGIPDLVNLFKSYTDTILFTHFGSWFYKDMQKAQADFDSLAKKNNIKIIVGYDGLEMEI